jgi:hypothetical protein
LPHGSGFPSSPSAVSISSAFARVSMPAPQASQEFAFFRVAIRLKRACENCAPSGRHRASPEIRGWCTSRCNGVFPTRMQGRHIVHAVANRGPSSYPHVVRLKKISFTLLSAVLFVITELPAQEATKTQVTINVTDPTGSRVANAQVRLIPSPAGGTVKLTTDDKGRLSLELKPGGYGLFVTDPGFKSFVTHLEVQKSKEVQVIPVVLEIGSVGSPTAIYPASFKDALFIHAFPYHELVILQPAEFKALPHTKVTVRNPDTNADDTYSGVPVADLLTRLGAPLGKEFYGIALTSYVIATGSCGDGAILSLAEVDPSVHNGAVLVADSMNGHPLNSKSGPFELVLTEDKRPVRWVRKLVSIELRLLD